MASTQNVDSETIDAAERALNDAIEKSTIESEPKEQSHLPSNNKKAHSWLRAIIPYASMEDFENQYHLGNYVIDRSTGQKTFEPMSIYVRLGMHFLYYGRHQESMLHWKRTQDILKAQSVKMGKQYDSPQSKSHIKPFIERFNLQSSLVDLVQPDPTKYSNFNAFFAREIKESARPIAEADSDDVVSSMADCRLTTYPTTDLATKYWIKGQGFTISKLLDSDELAESFNQGPVLIHRLAPQDYHRWHSPTNGMIQSIREISGTYYTVNPQAINEEGTLDVFCENRRSVMMLTQPSGSLVALIAIGAMLVGSIKYNHGIEEGVEVRRGQCLGAFFYGGSTVISLYQKGQLKIDEDLIRNSTEQKCETYVRVGWRVGQLPQQVKCGESRNQLDGHGLGSHL